MKKRGISAVVATIALVLLTFVAIAIISGFIVPFVRDNLAGGSECFAFREHYTFETEFGYNCYNGTDYLISIRGGSLNEEEGGRVLGMKLSFLSPNSEVVDIEEGDSTPNVKMLNGSNVLFVPKSGEVRTYVYSATSGLELVEVFPVLKNDRKVCDKTDSIRLEDNCIP